jgi:hypothetical protein
MILYLIGIKAQGPGNRKEDHMKRLVLMVLVLSMLILSGCIVSSSPSSLFFTMDKGDTIEFKTVVSPASCQAQWDLMYWENFMDTATGLTYTFTPDKVGLYQMKLTVMDPDGGRSNASRTWVIIVK